MSLADILKLAWRNVVRTRLRTSLSAVGVSIGTAAVVTLLAIGLGLQTIAVGRAASFGQLTDVAVLPLTRDGTPKPITPADLRAVSSTSHVKSVYTAVDVPAFRITLNGESVDLPGDARTPLGAGTLVAQGDLAAADGILVPDSVPAKLGTTAQALVGHKVSITAGSGVCCSRTFKALGPDRSFPATVVGVYQVPATGGPNDAKSAPPIQVNSDFGAMVDGSFADQSASEYLDQQGYSQLSVTADDARQTTQVASAIQGMGFRVQDRQDLLDQVKLVFAVVTAGLAALGGIALLVAAIGIANTMVMTVLERTREIGIMKAVGAEPGTVRSMFLAESAFIGLFGGLAGVLLSVVGVVIGNYVFDRFVHSQNPNFNPGSLFQLTPLLIAFAIVLAIGVSVVAGYLPSRRAVRLEALSALRYE